MDIKSVVPSQLISERGSDVVVINFGSANLRIGLATHSAPVVVPHCIAHLLYGVGDENEDVVHTRRSIGERLWLPSAIEKPEREETSQMVELQLKMKPLNPDQEGFSVETEAKRWRTLDEDEDESFSWTQVLLPDSSNYDSAHEEKAVQATIDGDNGHVSSSPRKDDSMEEDSKVEEPQGKLEPKAEVKTDADEGTAARVGAADSSESPREAQEGPDSEFAAEGGSTFEESAGEPLNPATDRDGDPSKKSINYRRFICGAEALRIPASEPYVLRKPICRGRLNVGPHYSLQQVYDDIVAIWDWVLTEKLSMPRQLRHQHMVVLVVPDTLDNRETKEILTIVLKDLKFRAAVVHQECVTATFGNGISSACVVNMGAQITSIVCIEDGAALPSTRIVLPFGGDDMTRCLLWIQRRWRSWPRIDTDPINDSLDFTLLQHIKEERCLILEGEQHAVEELHFREAGQPTGVFKAYLKALSVPLMGLFYPGLLAPEEYPLQRVWPYPDHEDVLEESLHGDQGRKPEAPDGGNGGNGNGYHLAQRGDTSMETDDQETKPRMDDPLMGLAEAVVTSILSTNRGDIQKKLFASVQLVGGVGLTRGLVDAVEERVLHGIPAHESIDTVAVLQNRTDAPLTCWKGVRSWEFWTSNEMLGFRPMSG